MDQKEWLSSIINWLSKQLKFYESLYDADLEIEENLIKTEYLSHKRTKEIKKIEQKIDES